MVQALWTYISALYSNKKLFLYDSNSESFLLPSLLHLSLIEAHSFIRKALKPPGRPGNDQATSLRITIAGPLGTLIDDTALFIFGSLFQFLPVALRAGNTASCLERDR